VEDEDASAFLLQLALDRASIHNRTYRVSTGADALAFLCKTGVYAGAESPGLVILDLGLPQVDGWNVLATMKRRHELRAIPVVVLSSSQRDEDKRRALECGAENYVVKEPSVLSLSRALAAACSEFVSFHVSLDRAQTYTLRFTTMAFECLTDGAKQINVALVLAEGSQVQLTGIDVKTAIARVRHGKRELWMPMKEFYDHAVMNAPTRLDFRAAPSL
jgi:CheY-like chemotaxis protein